MRGSPSSAATKCISDVPGLVKQTSTSLSTSVRSSDWAPFMVIVPRSVDVGVGSGAEERARVEDAVRVERGLDPAHQCELGRILELEEVALLGPADAVLARDRAAERHARREQVVQHLRPRPRGRPGRPRGARCRRRRGRTRRSRSRSSAAIVGDPFHELGERRPGHDDVDDVVGVVRLGDPEALLPRRRSATRPRRRGGRTRRARRARRAARPARRRPRRAGCRTSAPSSPRGRRGRWR